VDAVWLDDDVITHMVVCDSSFDPQEVCSDLVGRRSHDRLVVTGYGRHAAARNFGGRTLSEITAYARGASHLCPRARSVIDIGGQDTKVIALESDSRVAGFEMNDKCAAGTGRFLEIMACALGYALDGFGRAALTAPSGASLTSMCAVFAESEVTTLVHRGEDRSHIARGIHESIVVRLIGMLKRVGAQSPLFMAGGVARNPAISALLRAGFDGEIVIADAPQIVGALGAALSAQEGVMPAAGVTHP
jgi:predicted CoA-substrate-specific enzyme activase